MRFFSFWWSGFWGSGQLVEIGEELKKSSNKEHNHQIQESKKLQNQYEAIQNRIKKQESYI